MNLTEISNKNKQIEILIVDDIPDNLELLSNILDSEGMEISFANNGADALGAVDFHPPDLILLDISMPEMDGYEVCRILKNNPKHRDIPVIFLTALTDTENVLDGFKVGGQDYVTKPFNAEELLARVRTHLELKEKKEEIQTYAHKLLEMNNKQLQLNEILQEQKITIEQKNKDLTDSIDYAKVIQNSFLPDRNLLKRTFPESFICYQPKDILSGDFYYFQTIGNKTVVIAADCTGHGVPGALLSMLGTSLMNQIILHEKITDPKEILNILNREFRSTLSGRQIDEDSIAGDGMDLAICTFDANSRSVQFSSGKRPLYIVRNKEAIRYKGSIYSIGGYHSDMKKVFRNETIKLERNDMIYLFSDGFTDQFGGPNNKKIGTRQFARLLIELNELSLNEQANQLKQYFDNWQNGYEQVDDVLIIGIKYV